VISDLCTRRAMPHGCSIQGRRWRHPVSFRYSHRVRHAPHPQRREAFAFESL